MWANTGSKKEADGAGRSEERVETCLRKTSRAAGLASGSKNNGPRKDSHKTEI